MTYVIKNDLRYFNYKGYEVPEYLMDYLLSNETNNEEYTING